MDDGPRDYPFEEMCAQAQAKIREGMLVYQKFTCSGCGARLMIEEPNKFYEEADCDRCKAITIIRERGCSFAVIMKLHFEGGKNAKSAGQDHDNNGERQPAKEANSG